LGVGRNLTCGGGGTAQGKDHGGSMMDVSETDLDEWVQRTWERPPNFGRETLKELYEDDQRQKAKPAETHEIAQLKREVSTLRKNFDDFVVNVSLTIFGGRTKDKTSGKITKHNGLCDTINELNRRVGDGFRYLGVHDASKQYVPGDVVTRSGCMWHCHTSTSEQPGSSAHWQQCSKAGRDGRDAPNRS
jgi:hypothetical protein